MRDLEKMLKKELVEELKNLRIEYEELKANYDSLEESYVEMENLYADTSKELDLYKKEDLKSLVESFRIGDITKEEFFYQLFWKEV